ncbi:MAG TPA: MmcQ/YjbR family DNA-binding protein [Actinophytocola sp.]|uniref:MmcQ/YjbR family DNA-binding protein n=1 Tax=Actinophytocola sp. TaxID=1872138 RepID=UPI002DB87ED9|nr:MmcQ/YjbR family DNA-binding protein [Actinophytocola sp.]HEU5473536.1 MmcQ/YjbR family DNA-binding protein [Actinophytocola sp.]
MTPRKVTKVSQLAKSFPKVTEDHPYGPDATVYKVADKSFAILQPETDPPQITLKCEPSLALELRAQFPAVTEGYHVNKKHWNTVLLDGTVPDGELRDMVEHAYDRVVAGLPRKVRETLPQR